MALAKLGVCDMKKSEITEQIGCLRFISELILAPNDCSYNIVFRGYITCKSMYFYQKESRGEVYNFHSFSPSFFPPAKPHGVNFTLQTTPQEREQGKLYWGQAHVDV